MMENRRDTTSPRLRVIQLKLTWHAAMCWNQERRLFVLVANNDTRFSSENFSALSLMY